MNIKFFDSLAIACTAIVASVMISGGCAAQTATTQVRAQGAEAQATAAPHPGLLDPSKATETAPDKFTATFVTTKGNITVEVTRAWAPNGADRFYNLCKIGYYKDIAIFRSIDNFMFQFGIHGDPKVSAKWAEANIQDDPSIGKSNSAGTLSFAQTGRPNTRSVQMFVNTNPKGNGFLDKARGGGAPFVPFAQVTAGMDVVAKIQVTGENERDVQGKFQRGGNEYIKTVYENLDYIRSVELRVTN